MTSTVARELADADREDDDVVVDRRPVVADVDPDTFSWPADAPRQHMLVASGISSVVWDADGDEVGHVVMADLDDVDAYEAVETAQAMPDDAVLVRSSPGSYHVVGLEVRESFDDVLAVLEDVPACSASYVDEMAAQRRCVLRDTPKVRATGDVYKPAPEPVVLMHGYGERLSRPHVTAMAGLAADAGRGGLAADLRGVEQRATLVGETTSRSTYESMTDELGDVLDARGEGDG